MSNSKNFELTAGFNIGQAGGPVVGLQIPLNSILTINANLTIGLRGNTSAELYNSDSLLCGNKAFGMAEHLIKNCNLLSKYDDLPQKDIFTVLFMTEEVIKPVS